MISWANESKSQESCKGRGIGGTVPTPILVYINSKKERGKKKEKKKLKNDEKWHKNIKDYKY